MVAVGDCSDGGCKPDDAACAGGIASTAAAARLLHLHLHSVRNDTDTHSHPHLIAQLCDALDVDLIIHKVAWHQMNNILTVTLACFVLIYLMGNRNEARDHVLRYSVFFGEFIDGGA